MEYRQLGRSGVRVSPLGVGCMSFGETTTAKQATRIIHEAIDFGINLFDTANVYGTGASEEMVGKALAEGGRRDKVVLATKATMPMGSGPNEWGSSRYHLIQEVEASLRRLRTDRIDLFQIHQMDLTTPLEETLRTLDDLVRQGKVRYIGTSKWPPSLIAEAVTLASCRQWERFVSEQPPYNLLDRTIEHELIWTCQRHGLAILPWAPLATGMLSGQYKPDEDPPATSRRSKNSLPDYRFSQRALDRVEQFRSLAQEAGVSLAVYSVAWVLNRPGITAPIVGTRTLEHLRTIVKATDLALSSEDHARIDVIVPPGTAVADYYDVNVYARLRPKPAGGQGS